jgi:hypothetical protein
MRMRMQNIWGTALIAATLTVASGCGSAGNGTEGAAAGMAGSASKPLSPEAARLAREMVKAVSAGGSEIPVDVKFKLTQRPEVGKPVDIELALIPTARLERLYARFQPSDGLELVKGDHTEQIARPVAGNPISHTLTVIPRHDGIFSVLAIVLTDSPSESVSRNYTIPLIAGTGLPESAPQGAVANAAPHADPAKNAAGR